MQPDLLGTDSSFAKMSDSVRKHAPKSNAITKNDPKAKGTKTRGGDCVQIFLYKGTECYGVTILF